MERVRERKNREWPCECRECGGVLDCMPYYGGIIDEKGRDCLVIDWEDKTGENRTFEYNLVCRNDMKHLNVICVETPSKEFRAVFRGDKYNRGLVVRQYKRRKMMEAKANGEK